MPGGPPPDNPTEETAKASLEVGRDLERLTQRRTELVLQAFDEGASSRRVAFYVGLSESGVRRILAKHGSAKLREKVSAKEASKRERADYWPFRSKAEYEDFKSQEPKRRR